MAQKKPAGKYPALVSERTYDDGNVRVASSFFARARHPQTCTACQQTINVGQSIVFYGKDSHDDPTWVHPVCP